MWKMSLVLSKIFGTKMSKYYYEETTVCDIIFKIMD